MNRKEVDSIGFSCYGILLRLIPIEFYDLSRLREVTPRLQTNKKCRIVIERQPFDSLCIEMIVVVMTDKYRINPGQLLNITSWSPKALGAYEAYRRGSYSKYWIDQHVYVSILDENCRMSQPRRLHTILDWTEVGLLHR
jgi:hypothetical protein